jgi:hypothetical protein
MTDKLTQEECDRIYKYVMREGPRRVQRRRIRRAMGVAAIVIICGIIYANA